MKKFVINESEKKRILSMHYKHYKNNLINEEGEQTPTPGGRLPCANSAEEITSGKALLYQGCKGNFVKELQERLATANKGNLLAGKGAMGQKEWANPTDGVFGSRTKLAVQEFQSMNKVKNDGIVGVKTWAQISKYPAEVTYDVTNKKWIVKETGEDMYQSIQSKDMTSLLSQPNQTTATTTANTSTTTATTTASTANTVGNAAVQGAQSAMSGTTTSGGMNFITPEMVQYMKQLQQQQQQNPELAQLIQQYQNQPKRRGIFGRRRR